MGLSFTDKLKPHQAYDKQTSFVIQLIQAWPRSVTLPILFIDNFMQSLFLFKLPTYIGDGKHLHITINIFLWLIFNFVSSETIFIIALLLYSHWMCRVIYIYSTPFYIIVYIIHSIYFMLDSQQVYTGVMSLLNGLYKNKGLNKLFGIANFTGGFL